MGAGKFPMEPKPVITTRGLCYAVNARNMTKVYSKSQYLDNFEEVFQPHDPTKNLLNGHQFLTMQLNMQSKYLTDTAGTTGHFW